MEIKLHFIYIVFAPVFNHIPRVECNNNNDNNTRKCVMNYLNSISHLYRAVLSPSVLLLLASYSITS